MEHSQTECYLLWMKGDRYDGGDILEGVFLDKTKAESVVREVTGQDVVQQSLYYIQTSELK